MSTETVAQIDAQIFKARWGLWHATWEVNLDRVAAAMAVIDSLLEQRFTLMQAASAPPVAAAA